jgi:hypothetical protein
MEISTVHLVFILILILMIGLFIINPIESIQPANNKEGMEQNMIDQYYEQVNNSAPATATSLKENPQYVPVFNSVVMDISTAVITSDFYKNYSLSKSNLLPVIAFLTQNTKDALSKVVTKMIEILKEINTNLQLNTTTW